MEDYTLTAGIDETTTVYTFENYNRKTETVTNNITTTKSRTYHYDETNWLTLIEERADPINNYDIVYAYDNNGNTISKANSSLTNEDISYTYDSRDQLVKVTRGPPAGQTILGRYDYNAGGLRVRHLDSERGNVEYYYDGPAAEFRYRK